MVVQLRYLFSVVVKMVCSGQEQMVAFDAVGLVSLELDSRTSVHSPFAAMVTVTVTVEGGA